MNELIIGVIENDPSPPTRERPQEIIAASRGAEPKGSSLANTRGGAEDTLHQEKVQEERGQTSISRNNNNPTDRRKTSPKKLPIFCVCQQPEETGRDMVQCDDCDEWYHLDCLGLKPNYVDSLANFFCKSCRPHLWPDRLPKKQ